LPTQLPESAERALRLVRVDFEPDHQQPAAGLVLAATVIALIGSLVADAILVKIGETVFSSTKGYVHFRFSHYAKLTVIGVIIACVAWPIVTRISSDPRWLFFRQAIAVTLVLFLPDLYLLYKGQSGQAVAVLMLMHVAIALVTYNALVHIAKVRPYTEPTRHGTHGGGRARHRDDWDDDYGRDDYGRDSYFPDDRTPADRYPERAGYPGHAASYPERAGYPGHAASYPEPGRGYPEPAGRYPGHGEQDDPYDSYFRKPADPYEGRLR
jgi:hypothetical protein